MFNITLSPTRGEAPVALEKQGSTLVVDGEHFDFGFLEDGDILPQEAVSGGWLGSDVTLLGSSLNLTVRLPHGPNAPDDTRFPAPITVTQDGPIALPPYDTQEDEA